MRFSTVAILFGAAASASANTLWARQGSPQIPACALPCTTSADLGGCQLTDFKCLCTNQTFIASTTACIEKACTGDDLKAALTASQGLCAAAGVTLSAPTSTGTGTGTGTGTSPTPTSPTGTPTGTPSPSPSKAAGVSNGANAVLGLAAAGLVAFAL